MGEESTKSANMSKEEEADEEEELSSDIASALMVRNLLWLFKNDGLNFRLLFEKVVLIPLFIFIALFDDDDDDDDDKDEDRQQHQGDDDKDDDVVVDVDIIILVIVFSLLLLFFKMYAGGSLWFWSKKCFKSI